MELIKTFKIGNNLGLHARAAAKIVEIVGKSRSQLTLMKGAQEVDGSSILSIITLACPKGTEVRARIQGEDAQQLMEDLNRLFENNFGEHA